MLDVGERVSLLRKMIESGALQGWGEKSDAPVAPETRRRERGRKVRMSGEDGELPFVAISPGVNEAFSFPEASDGEEGDATAEPHRLTPARAGHPGLTSEGAHGVEDEHPLIALARKCNEAYTFGPEGSYGEERDGDAHRTAAD